MQKAIDSAVQALRLQDSAFRTQSSFGRAGEMDLARLTKGAGG